MAFTFQKTELPEVVEIQSDVYGDDRGFFAEVFKASSFNEIGIDKGFVQINHSKSAKKVLRGLHFQKDPYAQGKLVTAISGKIFDVAVDIRKNSENFGKWIGIELNSDKKNMLYVPCGFAHGFCVLSEYAEIVYYCTNSEYSPEHEVGIIWNDPDLNINWPIKDPILSKKDKGAVPFKTL